MLRHWDHRSIFSTGMVRINTLYVREGHFLYTVYHAAGLQRYIILCGKRLKKDYVSLRYGSGKDMIVSQ